MELEDDLVAFPKISITQPLETDQPHLGIEQASLDS